MRNGDMVCSSESIELDEYFEVPSSISNDPRMASILRSLTAKKILLGVLENVLANQATIYYNNECTKLLIGQVESVLQESVALNFLDHGYTLPSCDAGYESMPETVEMDSWNRGCIEIAKLKETSMSFNKSHKKATSYGTSFVAKEGKVVRDSQWRQFNFTMTRLQKIDHQEELLRQSKTTMANIARRNREVELKPTSIAPEKNLDKFDHAYLSNITKEIVSYSKYSHQRRGFEIRDASSSTSHQPPDRRQQQKGHSATRQVSNSKRGKIIEELLPTSRTRISNR